VVVGVPGQVTHRDGRRVTPRIDLDMTDLPDPIAKALQSLVQRVGDLEHEVERLRAALAALPTARGKDPGGGAGVRPE
jgi:hypothetical protein